MQEKESKFKLRSKWFAEKPEQQRKPFFARVPDAFKTVLAIRNVFLLLRSNMLVWWSSYVGHWWGFISSQQIFIICYGLVSSVSHLRSFGCQEPVRAPCSRDVWFNEHNKKDLRSFKHRHRKTWFCAGRQGGKAQQRRGAMTESLREMQQRLRREGEGLVVQQQSARGHISIHSRFSSKDFLQGFLFFLLLYKLNKNNAALWKSVPSLPFLECICSVSKSDCSPWFLCPWNIWSHIQDFLGNWFQDWDCFSNLRKTLNYLFMGREDQGWAANKVTFSVFLRLLSLADLPRSSAWELGSLPFWPVTLVEKMAWRAPCATHGIGSWKWFCSLNVQFMRFYYLDSISWQSTEYL